jgi:hypothetical protein
MSRHFSSSRRLRRREIGLEANDSPPRVTHLHVSVRSAPSRHLARNKLPLGSELTQLRARLLRMIVDNETARRSTKTLG